MNKKKHTFLEIIVHKFRILFAIGSAFIFGSWAIQNFQENDFRAQKEELLSKRELVEHQMNVSRVWLESLYTHKAIKGDPPKKDDELYYIKTYNYIESTLHSLIFINEITIQDSLKLKKENSEIQIVLSLLKRYAIEKQYDKIIELGNAINNQNQFGLSSKFQKSGEIERQILKEIKDKEKSANDKYLRFYILGYILIGIDFIISRIKYKIN